MSSPVTQYAVLEILGCGDYDQVAKCKKMGTEEMVAEKIMLDITTLEDAEQEVRCCSTFLHPCDKRSWCCHVFSRLFSP